MSDLPTKLSAVQMRSAPIEMTATGVDANAAHRRRYNQIAHSMVLTGWFCTGAASGLYFGSWFSAGFMGLALLAPMLSLLLAVERGEVTRAPTEHLDRSSVEAAVAMLVQATVRGVQPTERITLQRAIDDACAVLTAMCGMDPWVIVARLPSIDVPQHLASRGYSLATCAPELIRHVMKPHGAPMKEFAKAMRPTVVLMATIIRDFGLDPKGLAPPEHLLPGINEDVKRPMPAIAENVHRLADEWTSSGQLPDTLQTIGADAAVRELGALEAA